VGRRAAVRIVADVPIEPETKDWTFVLDEACSECGFDTREIAPTDVARLVRENAKAWPAVLERPDVATRPNDSTWSPLEYACHVRDVHRLYATRLELMRTQDDPLFPNWDQDAAAVDERYGEQDPATVSADLQAAAESIARAFDTVHDAEWSRPGRRSDGASFTIDTFARYYVHDPIHHVYDVTMRGSVGGKAAQ
jgi:hypothetical protein